MPLNEISPRDVGWISWAQTHISTQNPVRIQVPGKAQEQGLTACDLLALCSPTTTPLQGKVISLSLLASLQALQSTSKSKQWQQLSCLFTPHEEPPCTQGQGQGSKCSWCPREGMVHECCTSPKEKHGRKKKKKKKYIISASLLWDTWRCGHSQASQLFSAVVSSHQALFNPMSKQISLSDSICTHRTPGLPMWFWQSDWHSFWSHSTSFICLCACWMQPSFMLKIK